jgi:hypothetical protein
MNHQMNIGDSRSDSFAALAPIIIPSLSQPYGYSRSQLRVTRVSKASLPECGPEFNEDSPARMHRLSLPAVMPGFENMAVTTPKDSGNADNSRHGWDPLIDIF